MTFKKSGIILGIALAISAATTVASSAASLLSPTVTYTIKNQSSTPIYRSQVSCGRNASNFPVQIPAGGVSQVVTRSAFQGLYACQVTYKKSPVESCKFTIARLSELHFSFWEVIKSWKYPTVYTTSGNSRKCSGRITGVSFGNDGNFDVELKF